MIALVCLIFLLISQNVNSFPDFERCNQKTWGPGLSFNQIGIATFTDGGAADCVVTGIPATFAPCDVATITITSKLNLGHKLSVDGGFLSNINNAPTTKQLATCRHTSTAQIKVSTYKWTAPPNGNQATVNFGALCGAMTKPPIMFVALKKSTFNNPLNLKFDACPLNLGDTEVVTQTTAQAVENDAALIGGVGGGVGAILVLAGFWAYKRKHPATGEKIKEKAEQAGAVVKDRLKSLRPNGFVQMQDPRPAMGYGGGQQQMNAFVGNQQQFSAPAPQRNNQVQDLFGGGGAKQQNPYPQQNFGQQPQNPYPANYGQQQNQFPPQQQQYPPRQQQQFAPQAQFSQYPQQYAQQQQYQRQQQQQPYRGDKMEFNFSSKNPNFGQ